MFDIMFAFKIYLLFWIKGHLHEWSHFIVAKKYNLNPKFPWWKRIIYPFSIDVDNNIKKRNSLIQTEVMMAGIKTDSITLLVSFIIWGIYPNFLLWVFIFLQILTLFFNLFIGDYKKLQKLIKD